MERAAPHPDHPRRRLAPLCGAGTCVLLMAICATIAAAAPPPVVPAPTWAQKLSWILKLEDQRILREVPPPPPAPPPAEKGRRPKARAPVVVPPPPPDLTRLVKDPEGRVRRRAAQAIGRVGLAEGVPPLVALLSDPEPEVRDMAAFSLGLIGGAPVLAPLRAALEDPSPAVQGAAAEALGLVGDKPSAQAIAAMAAQHLRDGAVAALAPDELSYPLAPGVEAFRLGLFALTRLKAWDELAAMLIDATGRPVVRWWPAAYALSRVGDSRAAPALIAFLGGDGRLGRAFAARGLGALKAAAGIGALVPVAEAWRTDPRPAVDAIRALGQIGEAEGAVPALARLLRARDLDPNLRREVVVALGELKDAASLNAMLDLATDPWPPMRIAALRAIQRIDPDTFIVTLSGLDADRHWSVRAALPPMIAALDPAIAGPKLATMLRDPDARVVAPVVAALATIKPPDIAAVLLQALKHDDLIVRATAAKAIGDLRIEGGQAALADAYRAGWRDAGYQARAAALGGLAAYGAAALPVLTEALGDKDWAVRVRAAGLIATLDPAFDAARAMRPAPTRAPEPYADPQVVEPAVSPHVFLDTDKGTIEIELAVIEAPLTSANFLRLARQGFFAGLAVHRVVPDFVVQDGDNRGDGEGGPGYAIRDEVNRMPYLRGTVGMALDWADTGGSQFFITHSPQPHLDGRYTVFGRVVSGMDVVDRVQQGDVIRRVRTWDGVELTER